MKNILIAIIGICIPIFITAQTSLNLPKKGIFYNEVFIENKGQFSNPLNNSEPILFTVDYFGPRMYFTKNGIVFKYEIPIEDGKEVMEEMEEASINHHEITAEFTKSNVQIATYLMQWLNTNPNVEILKGVQTKNYYSYGNASQVAYGFNSITYKNIYPNIDITYEIDPTIGIKYTIVAHAGADLSKINYEYKGDLTNVSLINNELFIQQGVNKIKESAPICFYQNGTSINCQYKITNNIISFELAANLNTNQDIIIDPWISPITSLAGTVANANKGFDVDYDSKSNLYVYGGGNQGNTSLSNQKIAKYDSLGNLLWTFMGEITSPFSWNAHGGFGYAGNFIVDKLEDKIYMSQGFNTSSIEIIRLNDAGFSDGWKNIANDSINEGWEFLILPISNKLYLTSGSTASNKIVAEINRTTGVLNSKTFTGILGGFQDIVSVCSDRRDSIFTILASASIPSVNNKIYKLNDSITGFRWAVNSTENAFEEAKNKPYYISTNNSNGFNALTTNDQYLFYYDGFKLKTYNKLNGTTIGIPLSLTGQITKFQGGIVSDNCNHIYVGAKGKVKVFNFNGTTFDSISTIAIAGYDTNAVYDLKLDESKHLLYISGNHFVKVVDIATTPAITDSFYYNCNNQIIYINKDTSNSHYYTYTWIDAATNSIVQNTISTANKIDTLFSVTPGHSYILNAYLVDSCNQIINSIHFYYPLQLEYQYITICKNDTFYYNSHPYYSTGIYTDTIINSIGCNTTVFTVLQVNSNDSIYSNYSFCYGDSLLFNGHYYYQDTIIVDSIFSLVSCDTIHTITIDELPFLSTTIIDTICNEESYIFNSSILTNTGIYIDTLVAFNSCDSIVILNLFHEFSDTFTIYDSFCIGDIYYIDTNAFTLPNTYLIAYDSGHYCFTYLKLILDYYESNTINIIYHPLIIYPDSLTTFTCNDTNPIFYDWRFSDGEIYFRESVQRTFDTIGNYWVYLDVLYANGCRAKDTIYFQVDEKLSTPDFPSSTIAIYPNPVDDNIYILSKEINIKAIFLLNSFGELVSEFENQLVLPVSKYANGFYYLKIITANEHPFYYKISIQH